MPEEEMWDPVEPSRKFSLRKRRRRDSDAGSVKSLDLSIGPDMFPNQKKALSRVNSFANIIKNTPKRIMRTMSSSRLSAPSRHSNRPDPSELAAPPAPASTTNSPAGSPSEMRRCTSATWRRSTTAVTPYRPPPPTPARQRPQRNWATLVKEKGIGSDNSLPPPPSLTPREEKRQEAIFELASGESDTIEDLRMVQETYASTLLKFGILTEQEVQDIFGDLATLQQVHEHLRDALISLRDPVTSVTSEVGLAIRSWVPHLAIYTSYCSNQIRAKELLDRKKVEDHRLEDFLLRCLESPFSRKLDLWTFLDAPRSRLVKYPILVRQMLKYTPAGHPDEEILSKAIEEMEEIISAVDRKTGEAECRAALRQVDFVGGGEDDSRGAGATAEEEWWTKNSSQLECSGALKNCRGTKLHLFLFDSGLVLTRASTRVPGKCYQVYRQPIPKVQLVVEDLPDGQVKAGSFRTAITRGQSTKNVFRVSFRDGISGQAHTLVALSEHSKKQWLAALRKVAPPNQKEEEDCTVEPEPEAIAEEPEPEPEKENRRCSQPRRSRKRSLDVLLQDGDTATPTPKKRSRVAPSGSMPDLLSKRAPRRGTDERDWGSLGVRTRSHGQLVSPVGNGLKRGNAHRSSTQVVRA